MAFERRRSPPPEPDQAPVLKLLDGLERLPANDHEAAVVARIARFSPFPDVLNAVARVPKWYERWEVREALFQNPQTADEHRDRIGTTIAVIDLMREMDVRGLHSSDRDEIREDIRSLIRLLPAVDHQVVKGRARTLSRGRRDDQATPLPVAEPTAGSQDERRARESDDQVFLVRCITDPRRGVRRAALLNPNMKQSAVLRAIRTSPDRELLADVIDGRWWALAEVRKAILEHPLATPEMHARQTTVECLVGELGRYFQAPLDPVERLKLGKDVLTSYNQLAETDRTHLREHVGAGWTTFVAEILESIESEFQRVTATAVGTLPPGPPPSASTCREREPSPADPVVREEPARSPEPEPGEPAPPAIGQRSLADRLHLARTSSDPRQLAYLMHDPDDTVLDAILGNPALEPENAVTMARMLQREQIERLVENRKLYALTGVKASLLHNPHTPESVQLECLAHVSTATELMHVVRDPRVRSLEVKARARQRLIERYRTMRTDERVAAIKQTGGSLLNELWTEAFSDDRTLLKLLAERSLDEGVVLKIARSRIAPREVLAAIGRDPGLLSNHQVRLELALNPKTPRETVARIIPRLPPAERARIKASGQVADFVRSIA